jgi:hypothetical protein
MRVAVPFVALLLAASAGAQQAPVQPLPAPTMGHILAPANPGAVCRDRIQEVRRELGKPPLDQTGREDPLFIAAVDKRVGGCSVMVMRNDTSDIRPLPAPQEHRLMPAR